MEFTWEGLHIAIKDERWQLVKDLLALDEKAAVAVELAPDVVSNALAFALVLHSNEVTSGSEFDIAKMLYMAYSHDQLAAMLVHERAKK